MLRFFIVFALLVLFCSCDDNAVFHEFKELPGSWQRDSAVVFKFNAPDSLKPYNAFITLRNDNTYPFSNIFLVTRMQFPNGKTVTDTLEYMMAQPDGTWLGDGFGDLKESKLWYKENIRFNEAGTYQFKIMQAMRRNGDLNAVPELSGIRDVGLRIERINE
ncbi:gliding motility lipoprotein GldH [Leeuwenhoekiella parthenopeia]|uniref:Gliding motility lipoprotein GldH n=1 Tax=Leeuwenhoekiella parthenopeia TaxID=2890320 RepID=A0ABS8GQ77_9FLAO|nr:gliding motility lipoprotein GldH [Leeuwenhoekiella parthenopeia]MCC4212130.1 gliding motility lipoprotein GldH [Leeuwenhoekiella parthenopeia]